MRRFLFASLLFFSAAQAQGQSCYSQPYQSSCYSTQYQAPQAEPFQLSANVCGAQTQTYTVSVPVQVHVVSAPVAVAAPVVGYASPCQQSVGYAAPVAVPLAVAQCGVGFSSYGGFSAGYHQSFNRGFVNQGFSQGFNQRFGVGAVGAGTGVSISARDRRGNQVVANGANNVRIQRGLFGRINGAFVDSNKGLLGRINPF